MNSLNHINENRHHFSPILNLDNHKDPFNAMFDVSTLSSDQGYLTSVLTWADSTIMFARYFIVQYMRFAVPLVVIISKHYPRYWPFVQGIQRSSVNSQHKRPVTRSFGVFFDLRLNKRLSKQLWDWWFETPLCPLCRQCNEKVRI